MGLSSFLTVNGMNFPCPVDGFQYVISSVVNNGRNAKNRLVGQKIGRDLYKLNNLEWIGLDATTWQNMMKALEPFFVPVTFEDYRTGKPITITMYHGDISAEPLEVDPVTHKVIRYRSCKVNLIDCGWDE